MKKDVKHLSLRIDKSLLSKFSYVAKYYDKSKNAMLLYLIQIISFEAKGLCVFTGSRRPQIPCGLAAFPIFWMPHGIPAPSLGWVAKRGTRRCIHHAEMRRISSMAVSELAWA